ncbi:MAG: histidinol-phosphatase [Gemmatimonadetes bacterium]|nr:histidinol-phosphatase [Gemmatimonadota bacterium]
MSEPTLQELLEFATHAAWEAGRITLSHFQTGVEVETKADSSPVTVADRSAELRLREMIKGRYPDDGIVGEEHGDKEGTTGRKWIVDPIDGTKAFVAGVPLYGTLVGVEIDGEIEVGVINLPAVNEIVAAATGLGCWWNGRRTRVSEVDRIEDALVIVTEHKSFEKHKPGVADELFDRARLVRGWGDCYGYAMVATGRADVVLDPVMAVWDCAALAPVIEEAGGTFTTWSGEETIWGEEAVATNGVLFDEVMSLLD